MNIITYVKGKLTTIIIVSLVVLLSVSYVSGKMDRTSLVKVSNELLTQTQLNQRLISENTKLLDELKTMPEKQIEIVKQVDREICNGVVKVEAINNLPTKRVDNNETHTADIDDRLPDDLIKLLK